MKLKKTELQGVLLIEPRVFGDERGFFMESWKSSSYAEAGLPAGLVQSNFSRSAQGVLRGLHYQYPHAQGKLVSVLEGSVFDVAVDIRVGSPGFGQWAGVELSAANHRQLYIPEGFAHGFCVTSEHALVHYMCSSEFMPQHDAVIAWDDPDLEIAWPPGPFSLSPKDASAPRLREVPEPDLPPYLP